MQTILHITSGESVAMELRNQNVAHVIAFNEAMCEGDAAADLFSREFCTKRAEAYDISEAEYTFFGEKLAGILPETERIELYFDYDMFCAVNTITLLAYLEKMHFTGKITFHLVAQDGTANVLQSFPISLGMFGDVYQQVLVNRKPAKTGMAHMDEGIRLYLAYKQPDNEIVRYIKENRSLPRMELCRQILIRYAAYGIGDTAILKLIDACDLW